MIHLLESASGADRLRGATEFLAGAPPASEILLIGSSRAAVDDLIRGLSSRRRATFGVHRFTLTQLAARLAAPTLSARGLATCTRTAAEAVAARATFAALAGAGIPFFAPVARCPGFGRTLAATLSDLRAAGIGPAQLAGATPPLPELGVLLAAYEAELEAARLADRTALLRCAIDAVGADDPDPIAALPLLLLDVPIESHIERELVRALCKASPRILITMPAGDRAAKRALSIVLHAQQVIPPDPSPAPTERRPAGDAGRPGPAGAESSLGRLQRYLFDEMAEPPRGAADDTVRIFSAPGEGRETIEIARWILAEARAGTRFDDMVVFLRSPESYTALLETAFRRAGVPAYFARGTRRPNPSGRAFLALLACASDGLSAKRFAEYLSFGQVPQLQPDGGPPTDRTAWTGPRDEALGAAARAAEDSSNGQRTTDNDVPEDESGALHAPWKWEELIVDAAVIGGADRWQRRLSGLSRELEAQQAELASDEPDSPRLGGIERERSNLAHLSRFALPVIEQLAALPAAAPWGEWLAQLAALAPRVLRHPEPVLQLLAELEPMAAVGPVGLDEVRDVLTERLTSLTEEPPQYRYGRVLVTTLEEARGRTFTVVFVPGLAERIFPQRPREDALLLDALRRELSGELATQGDRIDRERLLLRLAVGAAERRVYLSYPRVDVVQGRPRVTSFYGLDVARATRGEIPDAEDFERDAFALVGARLAWPAPPEPADAIDAAEHDLATLAQFTAPGARVPKGAAQYLLELNPHLARALRTRYARWELPGWSQLDGIVRVTADTEPALRAHRLTARPYSPSALQHFAACPYRFFLASVQRLEPRREITPLEQLDPLTRGKLAHRVQADTLRALAKAGALPITAAGLAAAERVLGDTLDAVAAQFHEDLAPPILRVWQDEIAALRGDLVYWLRHLAEHAATWHPAYFEFGFGLPSDAAHDPHSRREAVELAGGLRLRGSVDLIERRADGSTLRVTDHKTGPDRTKEGLLIAGGETLQPVLYALAVEAALGAQVEEARLFFCTSRGGFVERVVKNDVRARTQGRQVLEAIDAAIGRGFLPPAPRAEACLRCDFHLVCGPHEEERVRRKESQSLADLAALRLRP